MLPRIALCMHACKGSNVLQHRIRGDAATALEFVIAGGKFQTSQSEDNTHGS